MSQNNDSPCFAVKLRGGRVIVGNLKHSRRNESFLLCKLRKKISQSVQ
jgi:hypothetical protein